MRRHLGRQLPEEVLSDAVLCVTELVTNSVQHLDAREQDHIEVATSMDDSALRVEVGDRGPGFASRRFQHRGGDQGWGLYIVDLLADRWGADRSDLHWVWFEIDLNRAEAPS